MRQTLLLGFLSVVAPVQIGLAVTRVHPSVGGWLWLTAAVAGVHLWAVWGEVRGDPGNGEWPTWEAVHRWYTRPVLLILAVHLVIHLGTSPEGRALAAALGALDPGTGHAPPRGGGHPSLSGEIVAAALLLARESCRFLIGVWWATPTAVYAAAPLVGLYRSRRRGPPPQQGEDDAFTVR